MPVHRMLVLWAWICGYVLGFLWGRSTGRIEGAREAMLNIIKGYTEGLADRA